MFFFNTQFATATKSTLSSPCLCITGTNSDSNNTLNLFRTLLLRENSGNHNKVNTHYFMPENNDYNALKKNLHVTFEDH